MEINKTKQKYGTGIIIGVIFSVLFIIVIVILLNGQTSITGKYPENQNTISLDCDNNISNYPFFEYDNSNSKITKIKVIYENNYLSTIYLSHEMFYSKEENIEDSKNINDVAMGKHFAKDGLAVNALGYSFSTLTNSIKLNLYAKKEEMTTNAAKYFLVEENDIVNDIDQNSLKKYYESKNFTCNLNN